MKATDILMDEHRVIERVIGALETAARRLEQGQSVRPNFFLEAVDFIQRFADGYHHQKEEGVLFQTMLAHGVPKESGPIAVMLAEHEQGRAYTRAMQEAALRLGDGDRTAHQAIIHNARGYASLLRQHIAKEDGILYPMSHQIIPSSEHAKIIQDFSQVDEGVREKYLVLADALEEEMKN